MHARQAFEVLKGGVPLDECHDFAAVLDEFAISVERSTGTPVTCPRRLLSYGSSGLGFSSKLTIQAGSGQGGFQLAGGRTALCLNTSIWQNEPPDALTSFRSAQ